MTAPGSITRLIGQLQGGDDDAVRQLWERYFQPLVRLASFRLYPNRCAAVDGEDVAQSVLVSFCFNARDGAFPDLAGRAELWALLRTKIMRKAIDYLRHDRTQKQGGDRRTELTDDEWQEVIGREQSPAFDAEVADECRRLLALLPDDEARQIAAWRVEGLTVAEIAERLGCVTQTVKRRLRLIRKHWS